MVSCITASIEVGANSLATDNIRYIFQDEILARGGYTLSFPVTITANGTTITKQLMPDGLFGLEYTSVEKKYYRFFLIEADRSTEPDTASTLDRKSYTRTILQYREFVGKGLYKEALGLSAGLRPPRDHERAAPPQPACPYRKALGVGCQQLHVVPRGSRVRTILQGPWYLARPISGRLATRRATPFFIRSVDGE